MKLRVLRLGLALAALVGCGGDDGVSVEEAIASKPTLFGLGVSIGDIPLTHPVQPQLFVEYGLPVTSGEGGAKNILHPEFYMPLGSTRVSAVSSGVVRDIIQLQGPDDMLILVTPDDADLWTIGYEHVSNVLVSEEDRISTGDIIADLSPLNSQFFQGYGKTALMVFIDSGGDNFSYCPFLLLDDSVRQAIYDEVNDHVQQWETNIGDISIFDEGQWHSVGCFFEQLSG